MLFGLVGFLGMRIGGPFVEYRILAGAMDDVAKQDDFDSTNKPRIIGRISQAVSRNSGMSPSTLDLSKIVYVVKRDGQSVVGVNYEVAVKVAYNISALLHFKHEAMARPGTK
jgi:hypothetical protein